MKDVVALVPNWLVARHALGAIRSFQKYYPDVPLFIVDDKFDEKDVPLWKNLYHAKHYRSDYVFDPDYKKLLGIPKTAYIQVPEHKGVQGEGHGHALEYAMKFIHAKWIFHLSTDTRIVKEGILEFLLDGVDDKCCGIGAKRTTKAELPSILKAACMWRGDLYHKYNLHFRANLSIGCDTGSEYFKELADRGYHMKYVNLVKNYIMHLRYDDKNKDTWEKLY